MELTTDSSGSASASGIPYGSYQLIETSAYALGDNYKPYTLTIADTDWSVTAHTSFTKTLTIQNKLRTTGLTFVKKDAVTGETLTNHDVMFTLAGTDAEGKPVSKTAAYSDGAFSFTDIPVGTYTMTETITGYTPVTYTVTVTAPAVATVANGYGALTVKNGDTELSTTNSNGVYTVTNGIVNTPVRGSLTVTKTDETDNALVGAQFTLYRVVNGTKVTGTANNATKPITVTASGTGSNEFVFNDIDYGNYILEETQTPAGYITMEPMTISKADFTVENFTFAKETTVKNSMIRLTLNKADADSNARITSNAATFDIYDSTDNKVSTVSTETDGTVELSGTWLVPGIYTLRETAAPTGYVRNAADTTITVSSSGEITAITGGTLATDSEKSFTVANAKTVFHVAKISNEQGDTIQNVTLTLTDSENATVGTYTVTDGTAVYQTKGTVTNGFVGLPIGNYTLTETTTPTGYLTSAPITLTLNADGTLTKTSDAGALSADKHTVTMTDVKIRATATLRKYDSTNQTALTGVEFTLYHGSTLSDMIDTNKVGTYESESGVISINALPAGNYVLAETAAATGYILPTEAFAVTFTVADANHNSTIDLNSTGTVLRGSRNSDNSSGVSNERKTGTLTIAKSDGDTSAGLDGVTFTLYKKADADNWLEESWNFITGKQYSVYTTASESDLETDGQLIISGLDWGDYKLVETGELEGYKLDNTEYLFSVTAENVSNPLTLTVENNMIVNYKNSFSIIKKDLNTTQLNGAVYTLAKTDSNGAAFIVDDLSDCDGETEGFQIMINGTLPIKGLTKGTYTLTEVTAPNGYALDTDPITFTISETGALSGGSGVNDAAKTVTLQDTPIRLRLTETDAANDHVITTSEATFAIYDGDGSTPAATVTTTNGTVVLQGSWLIPGHTYTIRETDEPDGYILRDTAVISVDVNGELVTVSGTGATKDDGGNSKTDFSLSHTKTNFHLSKVSNEADEGDTITSGVVLTVSNAEGTAVGTYTLSGGKASYVTNGAATSGGFVGLPAGNYTLTETTTPNGYLTAAPIAFTLNADGTLTLPANSTGTLSTDKLTLTMTDTKIRAAVKLSKYDATSRESLDGAQFKLYRGDSLSAITEANFVNTYTSANGEIAITRLDAGNYVLIETNAPTGYQLPDEPFAVTFNVTSGEHEGDISLNTVGTVLQGTRDTDGVGNARKTGTLTLNKIGTNHAALNGVIFTLTKGSESWSYETGKQYASYTDTATTTSAANGVLAISGLEWGTYTIVETTETDGYKLDTTEYTFTLNADNVATPVSLEAEGNTIVNEKNSLTIVKKSADGNRTLDGAVFDLNGVSGDTLVPITAAGSLTDFDSERSGFQVQVNGTLAVTGLKKGTYRLTELTAPNGYKLSAAVTFTMDDKGNLSGDGVDNEAKTVTVKDAPLQFKLTETDAADDHTITDSEASFYIYDGGERVATVITTDGSVTLEGDWLILGHAYTIKEFDEPDGYVLRDDAIIVVNTNGELETISGVGATKDDGGTNPTDFSLSHVKTVFHVGKVSNEAESGDTIDHVTLSVKNSAGQVVGTYTMTDGTAVYQTGTESTEGFVGLPSGNYTLSETDTPYGYLTAADIPFTLNKDGTLTASGGTLSQDKLTLTMTDEKIRTTATLHKYDNANHTALTGVEFTLYHGSTLADRTDDNKIGTYTTANGVLTITGLLAGNYVLEESKELTGYEAADFVMTFTADSQRINLNTAGTVLQGSRTANGVANIGKTGTLTLTKEDKDTGEPLSGVEYSLFIQDENGDWIDTGKTFVTGMSYDLQDDSEGSPNDAGMLTLYGLPFGNYKLVEKTPADGYKLDKTEYDFTLTPDNIEVPVKLNQRDNVITAVKNLLTLVKKDAEGGYNLDGAVFTLEKMENGTAKKLSAVGDLTDYDVGTAGFQIQVNLTQLINGLGEGTYRLTEITAPDGYALVAPLEFTVDADGNLSGTGADNGAKTITVKDVLIQLTLNKTDAATKKLITSGSASFDVYNGSKKVATVTTTNGIATLSGAWMTSGITYTLRETKAPTGYKLGTAKMTFSVNAAGELADVSGVQRMTDSKTGFRVDNAKTSFSNTVSGSTASSYSTSTARTGDTPIVEICAVTALLCAAAMVVMVLQKRRHREC